jgi:hypothetical protein
MVLIKLGRGGSAVRGRAGGTDVGSPADVVVGGLPVEP